MSRKEEDICYGGSLVRTIRANFTFFSERPRRLYFSVASLQIRRADQITIGFCLLQDHHLRRLLMDSSIILHGDRLHTESCLLLQDVRVRVSPSRRVYNI